MNHHIARCTIVLATLLGVVAPAHAQRRPITEKDLFEFVWVADPQISPDGSQVAFVRVTVDEKKDAYDTAIWLAKADGSEPPRPITGGTRDTSPRWSPDGRRLAFVRVGREGRPAAAATDPRHGDGGRRAAARGATEPSRSRAAPATRSGRPTAARSRSRPRASGGPDGGAEAGRDDKPPRQSDVRVITDAVYRANGVAGVRLRRPRSAVADLDRAGPTTPASSRRRSRSRRVSSPPATIAGRPTARGSSSCRTRRRKPYYYPGDSDLYAVAEGRRRARRESRASTAPIGAYALSPDGKRVAFVGTLHGNPGTLLHPAGSVGRRARLRHATQPHGRLRLRHQRRDRRRSARPARAAPERPGLERATAARFSSAPASRATPTCKRIDAATGKSTPLTAGNHDVMSYTADASGGRSSPSCSRRRRSRRSARARRLVSRGAEEADDVQRRAVRRS